MKIKVVAHTPGDGEAGPHFPGEFIELRDSIAEVWIRRGWAIRLPDEKKVEKKPEEAKAVPERAVIETPEDKSAPEHRETAALERKKKR